MSVTANGSGYATQLGKFTVSYSVEVNLLTNVGMGGVAQFVVANGDSLFAAGSGQAAETGKPGVFKVVENYTITGGTGRFAERREANLLHASVSPFLPAGVCHP